MANYIRRHKKQIELFSKRERVLTGVLKRNESEEKITRAAEKAREAKLQQLKAERNKRFPMPEPGDIEAKWGSMPVEDIIAIYKNRITENNITTD